MPFVGPLSSDAGPPKGRTGIDHTVYQTTEPATTPAAISNPTGTGCGAAQPDRGQPVNPRDDLALYLDTMWGRGEGYAHTAVGLKPHWGEGHYRHARLQQSRHRWPRDRSTVIGNLLDAADHSDVYVCPYLLHGERREKGTAVIRLFVHADIDGDLEPVKVKQLQGFAVASGSPGHGHVYLALAEAVDLEDHQRLCKALGQHFGNADAKISDNDLLRPPGTYSYKEAARGGDRTPVEWIVQP